MTTQFAVVPIRYAAIGLLEAELLTANWASLGTHGQALALEIARAAARAWVTDERNCMAAEEPAGNDDFTLYLGLNFGWGAVKQFVNQPDWTEDTDDFRVCHFCAVLEAWRRRVFGLSPSPADVEELGSDLTRAEARFWEADAAMNRAWADTKDRLEEGGQAGRDCYDTSAKVWSDALADALLARMLLNASVGTVTPSDVWECRIATDAEEGEEIEVHVTDPCTMAQAGGDFRCEPKGDGNRAEIALLAR